MIDTTDEAIEWKEEALEEDCIELGVVGKIWTNRTINKNAFMTTMKNVWQPTCGIDISNIGENKYVFQFHHWRNKQRVMEGQPWHFDIHAILLSDIKGNIRPSDMELYELPMWVRIYNLPFKGRLNPENIAAMGKKLGQFVKADVSGSVGIDKSIRLRIAVDVRKPLTQEIKVKMRSGEEGYFKVRYEKPPLFCYVCGRMGHGIKDCIEHKEEEGSNLKYGGWLKASPWKRMSSEGDGDRRDGKGSCARNLFITKPRQPMREEDKEEVHQMAGKLMEVTLLKDGGEDQGDMEQNTGGDHKGEGEGEMGCVAEVASELQAVGETNKVMQGSAGSQKKKGWKNKAREEGQVNKQEVAISGVRRKCRDGDDDSYELKEGETCGIKKKIVLDIRLANEVHELKWNVFG